MVKPLLPEERGPYKQPLDRTKRSARPNTSSKKALLPDKQQDWEYARAQYEAGIKSVRVIADEIGVTPVTVYARSGNEGWVRNTQALEQKKVEYKIALEAERAQELVIQRDKAERVNAEMQAIVLVKHRTDISRARTITMRLFKELEDMMDNLPELRSLGEIMRNEDDKGKDKLNDAYQKILSLGDRTDITKKLSEALKVQLQLERQAFGIIGALEDPETPQVPQAGKSEIETILGKFDLVLQKKGAAEPSASSPILGDDVTDVISH